MNHHSSRGFFNQPNQWSNDWVLVAHLAATLRVGDRLSIDVMQSATRSVAAIFDSHHAYE